MQSANQKFRASGHIQVKENDVKLKEQIGNTYDISVKAGTEKSCQLVIKNKTDQDWPETYNLVYWSSSSQLKSIELPKLKAYEKVAIELNFKAPATITGVFLTKNITFNFQIRDSHSIIAAGKWQSIGFKVSKLQLEDYFPRPDWIVYDEAATPEFVKVSDEI